MIDKLKQVLKDRVDNLDDEQAAQAAQAAVDFFKDKLPGPIGSKLEELVDQDGEGDLDLGDVTNKISGFLGG